MCLDTYLDTLHEFDDGYFIYRLVLDSSYCIATVIRIITD